MFGLIAAVTKTKWLPSPGAWLKALGLAIPVWIWGIVAVLVTMSWQFIFLFVLAVVHRSPIPNIFLVFAAGLLIADLIFYLLSVLLYSLLLRLMWSEVPRFWQWIKPPKKKRDVLFGWLVSKLSALVPALILLPFTSYCYYSSVRFSEILEKFKYVEVGEEVVGKMFIIWYVTAAYLYQARSLLKTRPRRTQLKNGDRWM